jgi:hypothetical protein
MKAKMLVKKQKQENANPKGKKETLFNNSSSNAFEIEQN